MFAAGILISLEINIKEKCITEQNCINVYAIGV
jgi:hypothetical protein